jgi:hypothetical protein
VSKAQAKSIVDGILKNIVDAAASGAEVLEALATQANVSATLSAASMTSAVRPF